MIGLQRGKVKLVPYSKDWKVEFEKEKKKLEKILGENVISIEHIGSTSIPGMTAKPIIDVMIGVHNVKKAGTQCAKILDKLPKYFYRPFKYNERVVAKGDDFARTHYIHIVRHRGRMWNKQILFRDYLINHKKYSKKYADLKKYLSKKHGGIRKQYTKDKTIFIKDVLNRAGF